MDVTPSDSDPNLDLVVRRTKSDGDADAEGGGGDGFLPVAIPLQRIITPIREEDKQPESNGASPVEFKPIRPPQLGAATSPEKPDSSEPAFLKHLNSDVDHSQVLFKKGQPGIQRSRSSSV